MEFRVEQLQDKRDSFENYTYHIFKGSDVVATYWHDYRGDGSGIEFQDGRKEMSPLGGLLGFLSGGGPQPLELTPRAQKYLTEKVG